MAKSFEELWEDVRPCPPSTRKVTEEEARELIKKMKRVFSVINVDFDFSYHALVERLNDDRNKPPISACEFEFVMSSFIRKYSKQLFSDVKDVEERKVKPRGLRADEIRPNNYEYGVQSRSTGVNIVMALQPNPRNPKQARINIITVMRKHGFKVNKGERIVVEGVEYDLSNITWYEVD